MKAFNLKRVIALLVLIAALVCVTALADNENLFFEYSDENTNLINDDLVFYVTAPDNTEYVRIYYGEEFTEFYNDGSGFECREVSINISYAGDYTFTLEAFTYDGGIIICETHWDVTVQSYGMAEPPEVVISDESLEDLAFGDSISVQITNTCQRAQNFSVALVPNDDGFNGFIDVVDCYLEPDEGTTVDISTAGYNDIAGEFSLIGGGSAKLIVCAYAAGYEYVETEPVVINVQAPHEDTCVVSKSVPNLGETVKLAAYSPDFVGVETDVRVKIEFYSDEGKVVDYCNDDTVDNGLYTTDLVFDRSGTYDVYIQYNADGDWLDAVCIQFEVYCDHYIGFETFDAPAVITPDEGLYISIYPDPGDASLYVRISDNTSDNTVYECSDAEPGGVCIFSEEIEGEFQPGHIYSLEVKLSKVGYEPAYSSRDFLCVASKESEHYADVDIEAEDVDGCMLINTDVCLNIDAPEATALMVFDARNGNIYVEQTIVTSQMHIWVDQEGMHDLVLLGYYGDIDELDLSSNDFSRFEYLQELSFDATSTGDAPETEAQVPETVEAGEDLVVTIIRDEETAVSYYDIRIRDWDNELYYFRHIEDYGNENIEISIPTAMLNGESGHILEICAAGPGLNWSDNSWYFYVAGEQEPELLFRAEKTDIVTMENIGINIYVPYDESYDYDEFYNSFFVGISDGYNTWYEPVNELANNHGYAYWSDFSSVWTGHYVLELYRAEDEEFVLFSYEGIDVNVSADETYEEPFVELPLIITGSNEENMIIDGIAEQINIRIEAVDEDYNSCAIYERSYEGRSAEYIRVNSLEIPEEAYMLRVIVEMYGYNYEGFYREWNCYIAKETDDSIVISYPGHAGNDIEIDSFQYVELNVEYPEDTQSVIVYRGTETLYVGGNTFGYYIGEGRYNMVACVITDDGRRVFGSEGFTITGVSQYGPAPLPEIGFTDEVALGQDIHVTVTPQEGSSDVSYNLQLVNSRGDEISFDSGYGEDDSPFELVLSSAALDENGNLLAQENDTAILIVSATAKGHSYSSAEYTVSIGEPGDEPFIVAPNYNLVNRDSRVAVYVGTFNAGDLYLYVFPKTDRYNIESINTCLPIDDYTYGSFCPDNRGRYVLQLLCNDENGVPQVVAEKEVNIDSYGRLEKPVSDLAAIQGTADPVEMNLQLDPNTERVTITVTCIYTEEDRSDEEIYCNDFYNEGDTEAYICLQPGDLDLIEGHKYRVTIAARAYGMVTAFCEDYFIASDSEIREGELNVYDEYFVVDETYSFTAEVPDATFVCLYDTHEDEWHRMDDGVEHWYCDVTFRTSGRHGLVLMAYYDGELDESDYSQLVPAGETAYINVESYGKVFDIIINGSETAVVGEPYVCEFELYCDGEGDWPDSYETCLLDNYGNVLYRYSVDGLRDTNTVAVPTSVMTDGETYTLSITCTRTGSERSSSIIKITAEGEYTGPANYVYTDRSEYMVDEQAHITVAFPDISAYKREDISPMLWLESGDFVYQPAQIGEFFDYDTGFGDYTLYISRSGDYTLSVGYYNESYDFVPCEEIEPVSFTAYSYGTAEGCEVEYPTSIEYCNEFVFTVTLPEGQGWTGASITRVPMNDEWEYVTVWDMELIEESQTITIPGDLFEPDRQYSLNLYRNAPGYDSWNFYRYFFVMSEPQEGLDLSFTGSEETWLTVDANTEVLFTVSIPDGYSYARLYINDYYSDIYFADGETVDTSWYEYFGGGMHVITMRAYSEETGWSAYAPNVLMVESVSDGPAVLPAVDVAESVNLGDKLRVTITPEQGCGVQTYQVMLIAGNNLIDNMYVHDVSDSESFDVYLDTFAWNRWSQNYYACENSVYVLVGAVSPRHDWVRTNSIPVRIDPIAEGTVVGYCNIHECPEIVRSEGCLKLPAGLTTVHSEAFKDIAADYVIIPDGITTMSANAFDGSNVKTIVMPEGLVTVIGDFDFLNLEHFIVLGGDWSGHFPAVD